MVFDIMAILIPGLMTIISVAIYFIIQNFFKPKINGKLYKFNIIVILCYSIIIAMDIFFYVKILTEIFT